MTLWRHLLDKTFSFLLDPSVFVCNVCGSKVPRASTCPSCGVTSCTQCQRDDDACPYCGEPG